MKCAEIRQLLYDYVRKDLGHVQQRDISSHIKGCPGCRHELRSIRKYLAMIGSQEPVDPPADFIEETMRRIDRAPFPQRLFRLLLTPLKIKIPLEAAGLACTAIIILMFYRPFDRIEQILPISPAKRSVIAKLDRDRFDDMAASHAKISTRKAARDEKYAVAEMPVEKELSQDRSLAVADQEATGMGPAEEEKSIPGQIAMITLIVETDHGSANDEIVQKSTERAKSESVFGFASKSRISAGAIKEPESSRQLPTPVRIRKIIASAKGTILEEKVNKRTGVIQSIIVEIPKEEYRNLIEGFNQFGPVRDDAGGKAKIKNLGNIRLNIILKAISPAQN